MVQTRGLGAASAVRFSSELSILVLAFISSVILARALGPADKGTLSALLFLLGVIGQTCVLGIEEASIVLVGQGRATFDRAFRGTLFVLPITILLGVLVFWLLAESQFGDRAEASGGLTVALFAVPLMAANWAFTGLLNSRGRVILTTLFRLVGRGVALLALVVMALAQPLDITRGVYAEVAGLGVGAALLGVAAKKMKASFRPTVDLDFAVQAFRIGLPIQGARVLGNLAARIDLLLVYAIAGSTEAGLYSVALTIGVIVSQAALAIAFVTSPKLAGAAEDSAITMIARMSRITLVVSIGIAGVLAVIVPVIVPTFFGDAFKDAVIPSLILVLGGIPWGQQLIMSRAWAARGRSRLMLTANLGALITMLVLDVFLIPPWGIRGAAFASAIAPLAGIWICVVTYKRSLGDRFKGGEFVPRKKDIAEIWNAMQTLAGRLRRKRDAP